MKQGKNTWWEKNTWRKKHEEKYMKKNNIWKIIHEEIIHEKIHEEIHEGKYMKK